MNYDGMVLKDKIRDIQNFPKEGILFKDITPLLADPAYFRHAVHSMNYALEDVGFDAILGPESRGFVFGTPLAYVMKKPFIPVRKAGKLPHKTRSMEYELEYGTGVIEIHEDAIEKGDRVVIVDDLLATGGTAKAICKLVEELGGTVAAAVFLIELKSLGGRDVLEGYNIISLMEYP